MIKGQKTLKATKDMKIWRHDFPVFIKTSHKISSRLVLKFNNDKSTMIMIVSVKGNLFITRNILQVIFLILI